MSFETFDLKDDNKMLVQPFIDFDQNVRFFWLSIYQFNFDKLKIRRNDVNLATVSMELKVGFLESLDSWLDYCSMRLKIHLFKTLSKRMNFKPHSSSTITEELYHPKLMVVIELTGQLTSLRIIFAAAM